MASYRPYAPPQSSFAPSPPNTNPLPPPPHPQTPRGQYSQNWGYGGNGSNSGIDGSSYYQQQAYSSSRQPPQPHYPYAQPPPPPPPPDSSYPPPPPPPPGQNSLSLQPPQPPSIYYTSTSQYSQYNSHQMPPPPPSPPPNSAIPPPPPPNSPPPPPPPHSKESRGPDKKPLEFSKGLSRGRFDHGVSARQTKPPVPAASKPNGNPGRAETEEERRLRKKREYEKPRQEEKHRQQKESQNSIMQKTQILSSGKGHGSVVGSRMGDRRVTPLLGGDRSENRLKKPTTFLCKMKFRNELPDPSAQMKLMSLRKDKERFTKYTITSLEKMWKPKLYVEPDLGIPLDLLDLSVYNPPAVQMPLAPEDEELLYDDAVSTPIKSSGIKRKERPTDKGMSWLVKTQYISPISLESAKQSLTEKQAKELKESKGRNVLDNLNSRERQIKEIEASFVSAKTCPVHATNKNLYPVEVWPLFPDFDRFKDPLVVASFDSAPTADSQAFSKLDQSTRDEHESKAIMKSYMASGSDPSNPEKFLAYMVPSTDELLKDPFDEDEDINYTWIREYNWDVRGDDVDDPTTYLVAFDDGEARYLPLPTKLNLRKKRAREGRTGDEVEHFPVPASITVRRRPNVASIELKDESEGYSNRKGSGMSGLEIMRDDDDMDDDEDGLDDIPARDHRHRDVDQYSGGEDLSD